MKKLVGSNHMKANGKVQVSVYLFVDEVRRLDKLAKRARLKRAAAARSLIVNALTKAK